MTSLTTVAPALDFPPPPVLAHTRNVRGDLGMFVNPYICPCSTCREFLAEKAEEQQQETRPQSTGTLEASDSEELMPTATTHYEAPPTTPSLSLPVPGPLRRHETQVEDSNPPWPTIPPGPPLVRVNAFSDALGRQGYTVRYNPLGDLLRAQSALPGSTEADLMSQLSTLRLRLKAEQDEVISQDYGSHDEMAAADVQWEDLDSKISAIEDVLTAFGIAFAE